MYSIPSSLSRIQYKELKGSRGEKMSVVAKLLVNTI